MCRAVAYSPDGRHLAAAGRNGQIQVWSVPGGDLELEIAAGIRRIRSLAYLPDGSKLVSAGEGRTVRLFDAKSGQEAYSFTCRAGKLMSMVVCGENLIATGGSDNVVRVWNWQTQREVDHFVGHTGSVAALAFDAASQTIISGSFDTTVRVWSIDQLDAPKDTAHGKKFEFRIR